VLEKKMGEIEDVSLRRRDRTILRLRFCRLARVAEHSKAFRRDAQRLQERLQSRNRPNCSRDVDCDLKQRMFRD